MAPSYANQVVKVDIGGMMCEYCVNLVKTELKKIKTIKKADVYYKDPKRGDGAYIHLRDKITPALKAKINKVLASKGFYIKKVKVLK